MKSIGFDKRRMVNALRARSIDGLVLTSPENVFYTTGYPVIPSAGNPILFTLRNRLPAFVYIGSEGEVTLICWGFSVEGVKVDVDKVIGVPTAKESVVAIRELLSGQIKRGGRIAIESTAPYSLFEAIRGESENADIVSADEVMTELRLIKTPAEIDQIVKSTELIGKTVQELYDLLRVGMSRLELIREAKCRLLKNGAGGISHATFSFGKGNPEIALDERLEKGDLVTLDLGGVADGYCSDTRRYAFIGDLPKEVAETYQDMVAIVDRVGLALKPGRRYSDIMQAARDAYEEYGREPLSRMTHVGHNIGLETEEQWVDEGQTEILSGMVINIELYTHVPPFGQIGNEETFVVGESSTRRISNMPREIRVI